MPFLFVFAYVTECADDHVCRCHLPEKLADNKSGSRFRNLFDETDADCFGIARGNLGLSAGKARAISFTLQRISDDQRDTIVQPAQTGYAEYWLSKLTSLYVDDLSRLGSRFPLLLSSQFGERRCPSMISDTVSWMFSSRVSSSRPSAASVSANRKAPSKISS